MTRLVNSSRTKQGRSFSGSSSPRITSCLSRCAKPGLTRVAEKSSGQKEVTLKQRLLEERQDHHSCVTGRGT